MVQTADVGRYRLLTGRPRRVQQLLLVLLPVAGILQAVNAPAALGIAIFREQYLGLFMGLALPVTFLSVPATARASRTSAPWYDWLLAVAGAAAGGYVAVFFPAIAHALAVLTPDKWGLGAVAVVLFLEAARRVAGRAVAGLVLAFILYAKFAWLFPGLLQGPRVGWERLAVYLYLDSSGLMGLPLSVAGTVVLAFIVFGQVLYATGAAEFLVEFARATMGRFRGGPAKMSIVSSSLFGTISGSAVANVAVDGPVTIPLMKRAGYPPHLAAAIEAVASTGGQLMPPVMGVAAFIMAEFLNMPYAQVAAAALLPAALYYVCLFFQVDFEAAKAGLRGLAREDLPRTHEVLRRGLVFGVAIAAVLYGLYLARWRAEKAGVAAAALTLVAAVLRPSTRPGGRQLLQALEGSGKALLDIAAVTGVASFMIAVLNFTGLGFKLALVLTRIAGDSLVLLLGLTAAAAMVLGMGMPTAAVYILLAVLVAPALVQAGVLPLAAHLFVFYFGMLSMVTPPVCLATYTAASLAGADFWRAGWTGMRLAGVAYVVPFLFALSPELIGRGSAGAVTVAAATAVTGAAVLAAALTGYLLGRLGWVERLLLAVASLGLLTPASGRGLAFSWGVEVAGAVLAAAVLVARWYRQRAWSPTPQAAAASLRGRAVK
ncbi:MAG: TRAP transporter fused permease subunit [Armatimonadota bacterium]|nr:TRAP transporter fused permease subunit [Armatimonadota bacterium]MDR7533781.1 TRAP transporter fused permease subunit [Armatimonadota bacterium]MDR7535771.1 TRAP transporter fused permease subunit [Armatimonadota bacterium]